jgi:hypothetical protein
VSIPFAWAVPLSALRAHQKRHDLYRKRLFIAGFVWSYDAQRMIYRHTLPLVF